MEKSLSKLMLVIMVLSVFAGLLAGIPVGVAADTSMVEDMVIAIFQPEQAVVGPRWKGDILLAGDPGVDEVHPRMASASNGDLYAVVEHEDPGDYSISIFRSTDGGETWSWWWSIIGTVEDVMNPDIAVGEGAEDWVFVVYELGDYIYVFRTSFDGALADFEIVDSNPFFGVKYPRITTDCIDYPDEYYVYVAYDRGTLGIRDGSRQDYWELWFARSLDFGDTYVDQTALWLYSRSQLARPDIAYGDEYVYVSFENWDGPDDSNIYVMRNTQYGNPAFWDAAVQVSTSTDQEWDSAVVATNGGGVVVAAYTRWWNNVEDDVWYSYSYDWGVTWSTDWWLSSPSLEDDKSPDLAVSNSYGRIHAVYWSNYDVIYKSTDYNTPALLNDASPQVINEGNLASSTYSWMTVAVNPTQPTETEACVAWTDYRNPTYDVYFDANYITVGLSISVYTDKYYYSKGDMLYLGIDVKNPGSAVTVCVEVWVEKPFGPPVVFMHKHAITLKAGLDYSNPSQLTFGPLPSIPPGVYTWHAAILDPITHTIIVEDTATCEFV